MPKPGSQMRNILLLVLVALLALSFADTLSAQEEKNQEEIQKEEASETKKKEPSFPPPFCNFTISFPQEPDIQKICDKKNKARINCFEQARYTYTYTDGSKIDVRAICNRMTQDIYDHYSERVMDMTVKAMINRALMDHYETSYRAETNYKQAALVGEGKRNRKPTIFIAQLWIGQQSSLSVEAEMSNEKNKLADEVFSKLLKSIHYRKPIEDEGDSENKN
ncbi:MAG: hypothetical protein L6Q57_08365 [Alphaproteobacteria bacterium]|nr:hypothetical protein [Alphaproteobacteria bacterium]